MNTEQQLQRTPRGPMAGFAVRFLSVLGHYAVGIGTFSVMAAANVPGGGNVMEIARHAVENTGLLALAVALAAGRWWV